MSAPGSEGEFARRLTQAIQQRGLSLARLRHRLQERGLSVSEASLSYWCTGRSRPARNRSREIVRALEEILETEAGWLVSHMPQPGGSHTLAKVLNRRELLEQARQEFQLASSVDWRFLSVHYRAVIDEQRRRHTTQTWAMVQAISAHARGWSVVVEGNDGYSRATALGLARINREVRVAEDLTVVEFQLDHSVERGGRVLLGHEMAFDGDSPQSNAMGYALKQQIDQLVLEVTFEGEMPREIGLSTHHPVDQSVTLHPDLLYRGEHGVQAVLRNAVAGLHEISWQW
ncbi:hypothetical protein [Luteococcus sp. OSA5]|uniref:hypothetical protein n=1 Tax=Luteococcus sp. OSA5 TaxID=3401630 RepID=UPI003B4382E3